MKRFIVVVCLLFFLLVGCSEDTLKKIKQDIKVAYVEDDTSDSVQHNFYVPLDVLGYNITWSTSSPYLEFVKDRGLITRSEQDEKVSFKASFVYKQKTHEVSFEITIIKRDVVNTLFDFDSIVAQINIPGSTASDIHLPTLIDGVTITWLSDHQALSPTGVVQQQDDNVSVILTATLQHEQETHTQNYTVTVVKKDTPKPFNFKPIINQLIIPTIVEDNLSLPTLIDAVTIVWVSDQPHVITHEGVVTKQSTNTAVKLTATLTKDKESMDVVFDVIVVKETQQIDYQAILNKINLPASTDQNITLPTVIDNVSITWFSHHNNITNRGVITQVDEDITATLTAMAGDVEKLFSLTILKKVSGIISSKTPIVDVIAMSEGTTVEVHGVVTSLMTHGNFTIEDSTGAIPVYFGSNNTALEVGRVYMIQGVLSNFNGLKQIGTAQNTPIITQTLHTTPLPPAIDLSGYSLDYDDVTSYEGYVVSYRDLEVVEVLTKNNALELTVKNEAGETTNARLDQRVNDQPYAFASIKVGDIVDLYNVTVGQYQQKAQFLYSRRSAIESRDKNPDQISFYGVANQIYTIGDSEPHYLEGITAKNGHGVDFTHLLEVNTSQVNLNEAGVYTVIVQLSTDINVKVTYQLTVRNQVIPGNYSGYYQSLSGLTGQALNNELQRLIRTTGRATGTTPEVKQVDKWNGSYYLIYTGMGPYGNREHTWPSSLLGSTKDDLHNLRAANVNVNSSRSNFPFIDNNKPYTGNEPYQKIGSAWYPGDEHIGDVARIVLYISIRYNLPLSRVGNLNLFLKWHQLDPVNEFEETRNDRIYNIQSNRNPFIDHPELVELYFGGATSFAMPISLITATLQLNNHYQMHL